MIDQLNAAYRRMNFAEMCQETLATELGLTVALNTRNAYDFTGMHVMPRGPDDRVVVIAEDSLRTLNSSS